MKKILGIELGSTRIKSVLINEKGDILASGSYPWENRFEDGYWTYALEEVKRGIQESYQSLSKAYGSTIETLDSIGISAMMHGYLAFDENWELLTPFRTWRNTTTEEASKILSKELECTIPQRWSIAHLYQAYLNHEPHVKHIAHLTTLAGYVHHMLTGKNILGIGDASGMFPIQNHTYNQTMVQRFQSLTHINVNEIFPQIMLAGDYAGCLTKGGSLYLDPTGALQEGAILAPPEGDAGTGMVATNSILPTTSNVSAGTSAFLMAVLEKPLPHSYPEIDRVMTPTGCDVAMVHTNTCTSEINAWVGLFHEVLSLFGTRVDSNTLYTKLFEVAKEQTTENLLAYNFLAGEPIAHLQQGTPLLIRRPKGNISLAEFMRAQLYSSVAALRFGIEILEKEGVFLTSVCGHGGLFKTDYIGQEIMSLALNTPITILKHAGEGGAYGMALLAAYALDSEEPLSSFLEKIFSNSQSIVVEASIEAKQDFERYMKEYKKHLGVIPFICEEE